MNIKLLKDNRLAKLIKLLSLLLCQLICLQCNNALNNSHNNYSKNSIFSVSKHQEEQPYVLADRETLLMRGYSTSFTDGYMDGCQTGQFHAGDSASHYLKNQEHAKISKDYIIGWEQGNSFCYEHMKNLIKNSGSNDSKIYRSKESIEREKQRMWLDLKK